MLLSDVKSSQDGLSPGGGSIAGDLCEPSRRRPLLGRAGEDAEKLSRLQVVERDEMHPEDLPPRSYRSPAPAVTQFDRAAVSGSSRPLVEQTDRLCTF